MVEIKHKDFIDVVQIMHSLWITARRYLKRENPDSPEFTRFDRYFGKVQDRQSLY